MSSKNGEVKKSRRQRAIITIDEREDGKFNASLVFEPSIQLGKSKRIDPKKQGNIAVQVAHFVWLKLKEQQRDHVILTDEL